MGRDLETTSLKETMEKCLKGTPLENTHRVEIFVDGRMIMGTTTTHNPKNSEQMVQMLKDFVDFMEAPKTPISDQEVLGERSP